MILDNMKFTDKESLTFVPIKLINTFCHFLDVEHPDVDFKCIKAIDIQRNPELRKKISTLSGTVPERFYSSWI